MTAVLNNGGGFYSLCAYIEEARRIGITIEPPDVNGAQRGFTFNGNTILAGLYTVRGLKKKSIGRICKERGKEMFKDLYDFLNRSRVGVGEAVNLVKSGALRSLLASEPEALACIKVYFRNGRKSHVARQLTNGLSLAPYSLTQRVIAELETMQFAVSAHPLNLFPVIELDSSIVPSTELGNNQDKLVTVAGWMVTSRRAPTSDGAYIKFATLEDKFGLMEIVLFPDVYDKYGHVLKGYGPFRVTGKVQSRVPKEANIIVESVRKITAKNVSRTDARIFEKDLEDDMFFDPHT